MRRRPPDQDVAKADAREGLRKLSKRALIVLGASLLLQPAGGSSADAKHRKRRAHSYAANKGPGWYKQRSHAEYKQDIKGMAPKK